MRAKYYFWRFVHNALVHPLIGVFGWNYLTELLHEWTGKKWEEV